MSLHSPHFEDQGKPDGQNSTLDNPISADGAPEVGKVYNVPARQGRAVRLAKGQTITIINTHGTQVCDFWAFNAFDLREYLSMEHLHGYLSHITPKVNDTLVSNRRRPLLTFEFDDSPGVHDTVIAACDLYRYRLLGVTEYHDNCTDNLRMAMLAIGLRASEIPSPLNLWMNTPVRADGSIAWLPTVSKAGDRVEFRAKMDLVVVMSACPQDMVPINGENNMPVELHFRVDQPNK
ncbi:urea carboxylase-associated family protein [Mesorhizobium sp.]|uniref:urea carboxylase-associated family protein n=1 Tax=Mesorhizobium sp. TaxID=1871066 RepID=UPI000FEAB0B8|nr:urea carboxylase-associated family protein [Mesorhizobium sp.]RWA97844.1 MAG: urea carboxylase-associated family protein [Mesorhizobium sp.]